MYLATPASPTDHCRRRPTPKIGPGGVPEWRGLRCNSHAWLTATSIRTIRGTFVLCIETFENPVEAEPDDGREYPFIGACSKAGTGLPALKEAEETTWKPRTPRASSP